MKIIITILFLISGSIIAQTASDSGSAKQKELKQEQTQIKDKHTLNEQIGEKSNPGEKEKSNKKKKDVFIDKDGDGICDSRQSGMSFNKLRQRLGSGQKGPSKGRHGSGNGNGNQN